MNTDRRPDTSSKFKIGEKEMVHHGKFINFYNVNFETVDGQHKQWEMIGRDINDLPDPLNIQKNYGGVDVVAIATQTVDGDQSIAKTGEKMILVEKIFRVPIMNYVLEFPAGFKDPHETDPVESGLRELKEETGYVGENGKSTYVCRTDPWKSDERGVIIYCDVDLSKDENKNPVPELEEAEDIQSMWIKLEGLRKKLEEISEEHR